MTAIWPTNVTEYADSNSYSERPEQNVVEFAPEVGPPMSRRRSSISSDLLLFSTIPVTSAEYDVLVDFYRNALKDGALTFFRKHPRNLTGQNIEFKFVEPPQWSAIDGTLGRIALSLRRMP